ncbi:MAG: LysR substrate-binding domain-containing protein [Sciscionella sp.]
MELALHRLRMLRELARRGTVTEAAAGLHYTVSAVSQQLALLEKDVGAPLFERVGRRVRLTELGWTLAGHAEEILAAEERARMAMEQAQENLAGKLTVGVFATVAAGLLPEVLTDLAAGYPGLSVMTREVDPDKAPNAARNGDIDVGFMIDYPDAPMAANGSVELVEVGRERIHLAARSGVFPAGRVVELAELAGASWILSSPASHFGRAVRVACKRAGFDPGIVHEVDEQATAMAMVAADLGITLVSDLGLAFRPAGVDVLPLAGGLTRNVAAVYRPSALRRPALQVFLRATRAAAARLEIARGTSIEEQQVVR